MIVQKIKTLLDALRHPLFALIKIRTHGYLYPKVYREIYEAAISAPAGHAIDIGPAQGGSTIAIGLGFRKSQKIDWKVYGIEKGVGSDALVARDNWIENKNTLIKNIERYKLEDHVKVIMKYSHEAFIDEKIPRPISILSIDADGALDRDFNLFFDSLAVGAKVVIDDYDNLINRHGRKLITGNQSDIDIHITNHKVDSLAKATPLGKELLTYKFVNYLIDEGLLVKDKVVGTNTFFGHKPHTQNTIFTSKHMQDMQNIRAEIEQEFWNLKSRKA